MANVVIDSTKLDQIKIAIASMGVDTSKALADISAKITALQGATPDAATATELGDVLASIQALDAKIVAADPGAIA